MGTTTCTSHCSQCGRHFHSLEAFDLHHEHDETGWPVCLDPLDLEDRDGRPRLEAFTEHGECRMYAEVQHGVTVWRTIRSQAETKRLMALRARAPRAKATR